MKHFLFLFSCFFSLSAGTVRLVNDSPYKLKVMIRGADGTYLSEMILSAQHSGVWTDFANFNYGGLGNQDSNSQTPYRVMWYCLDGTPFSVCDQVNTGNMVTALTCPGARSCSPSKPQSGQPQTLIPNPEQDFQGN